MSEIESDAQAVEALMGSINEPVAPVTETAPEQAPAPVEPTTPVEAGTTDTSDSFTSFDESLYATLPPEAKAIVDNAKKSFQGDYTRKMQEIAEQRKQFEGIDPDLARQSVEYVTRLANDPEFLVDAYQNMKAALEQMGLSSEDASAQAAAQITQDAQSQQYDDDDDEDDGIVPSRIQSELSELKQWKEQVEAERYQTALANEALRQEQIIRTEHPEYGDDDLGNIMELAWSTGGNLIQASQKYDAMRDYFAKTLLAQKSSVPGALDPAPANSQSAEPARTPKTLEEAFAWGMERIRQQEAQ